jgi:hypothetical protein
MLSDQAPCRGTPLRARSARAGWAQGVLLAVSLLPAGPSVAPGEDGWEILYTSPNLSNHLVSVECSPGDPTTNCPCSTADVSLVVYADHGEVTANVLRTNVYVNAIGYKPFQDAFPHGDPVKLDVFRYRADLRLPVVPLPSVTQTQNAQSAHLMIQLWDGSNRLWQSNKVALEATLFWTLNPWQTNELGKVFAYTSTTGPLQIVDTGLTLPVDTNWHRLEFVADFAHARFVSARADGVRADLSTVAVARVAHTNWGNELLYQITQESCSTYPNPGYTNIFTWTMQYRNLEFSRLRFRTGWAEAPLGGEQMKLEWPSEPWMKYQVWTSQDLRTWANLSGALVATGLTQDCCVSATNELWMFYRIHVVP